MSSILTPDALRELKDLLLSSRRQLSIYYRDYRIGMSSEDIAEIHDIDDLKKVNDNISALQILFGHKKLSKVGNGRQIVINEVNSWLSSNIEISSELEEHFRNLLKIAGKTNHRKKDNYTVPSSEMKRSIYKRRKLGANGRQSGVYVLTHRQLVENNFNNESPILMKIGHSDNVWQRIAEAQTWNPEPLELLRVFLCDEPKKIEAKFHIALDTLGCSVDKGGGIEWFNARLDLIDEIARTLSIRDCSNDVEAYDTVEYSF